MKQRLLAFFLLVLLGIACPLLPASADSGKIASIEDLFRNAQYREMRLSPDGRFIAALVPLKGRSNLAVIDLQEGKAIPLTGWTDLDVLRFEWVNDKRLVIVSADLRAGLSPDDQFFAGTGGIYAVDRDGSNFREIVAAPLRQAKEGKWHPVFAKLIGPLHDGSNDVLIQTAKSRTDPLHMSRVDTVSGRSQTLTYDMPGDLAIAVPDASGVLRAVLTENADASRQTLWFREAADKPWVRLDEFETLSPDAIRPVAFDASGTTLYVLSSRGRKTTALFGYDLAKRQLGEELIGHPEADIRKGDLHFSTKTHELLGVTVDTGKPETVWLDERWAKAQATVDASLPNRINWLSGQADGRLLVASTSDTTPVEFYLYDVQAARLQEVGRSQPWIDPQQMANTRTLRYAARDGLSIPAYLTLPKGAQAHGLPLVVLVHGGPWARDEWGFDPEVQLLASRGYAVLQPEFRGSTGFGWRHFSASFKQWGLSMQDDLDDGVAELARQGIVDPHRVCVMGASYGGFAVLSALARDPGRYRCGIDIVGVSDPALFFSIARSDMSDSKWIKRNAKVMIGDPDKDAATYARISPLQNAAAIKAPVLMAYGGDDYRLPIEHGERMRDALQRNGGQVEWMLFPDESHGFLKEESRYRLYHAVERFLARNLPVTAEGAQQVSR
jgi:dipeptidyl aminopeptidase/acylaminoacyl peptidase